MLVNKEYVVLKFIYSCFLGLLLAFFVGYGIATFYPSVKMPEYPTVLSEASSSGKEYTPAEQKVDRKYQADIKTYNVTSQHYSRNVAVIALVAALALLVLSLVLHTRITVLADGLLLGGIFTLLYSIGRSFAGEDPKYSFAVTAAGVIITMIVGYAKFIKPTAK